MAGAAFYEKAVFVKTNLATPTTPQNLEDRTRTLRFYTHCRRGLCILVTLCMMGSVRT